MKLYAYNLIPGLVVSFAGKLGIIGEYVSRDCNLESVTVRVDVEGTTVLKAFHYCDLVEVVGTAPDFDPDQMELFRDYREL
jgi:hypothetical protein